MREQPLWRRHYRGRGRQTTPLQFTSKCMLHDGVVLDCVATLEVDADAVSIAWTVEATFDPELIAMHVASAREPKVTVPWEDKDFRHVVIARVSGTATDTDIKRAKALFEDHSSKAGNLVLSRVRIALAAKEDRPSR